MIPYRNEKIQNAVAFFARQHKKKAKWPLYQTFLFKYLAFFDFLSLKETGRPALELKYRAMKRGPVPIEIYEDKTETSKYRFVKDDRGQFVVCKVNPKLDCFSPYEIDLMERLIEIFAQKWMKSDTISEASHESIAAWQRTWNKQPNSIIDYALEFDNDIFTKKESELTFSEEAYLTYKAVSLES